MLTRLCLLRELFLNGNKAPNAGRTTGSAGPSRGAPRQQRSRHRYASDADEEETESDLEQERRRKEARKIRDRPHQRRLAVSVYA